MVRVNAVNIGDVVWNCEGLAIDVTKQRKRGSTYIYIYMSILQDIFSWAHKTVIKCIAHTM